MKNISTLNGLFISGTDTDVGKTYIGAQIVAQLHNMGIPVVPRKPIESGCKPNNGELLPDDASKYFNAVKGTQLLADICPFRFEPAISPQRAARLANTPISVSQAQQACLNNVSKNDFLVVEGAGGFYSPLCEDGLNADLAKSLQHPVLLVAEDRLGCINQILLSIEAIKNNDLDLYAIVLNNKDTSENRDMNNFEDLKSYVDTPIFTTSQSETINENSSIIKQIKKGCN